jgi:hypothetical protein
MIHPIEIVKGLVVGSLAAFGIQEVGTILGIAVAIVFAAGWIYSQWTRGRHDGRISALELAIKEKEVFEDKVEHLEKTLSEIEIRHGEEISNLQTQLKAAQDERSIFKQQLTDLKEIITMDTRVPEALSELARLTGDRIIARIDAMEQTLLRSLGSEGDTPLDIQ